MTYLPRMWFVAILFAVVSVSLPGFVAAAEEVAASAPGAAAARDAAPADGTDEKEDTPAVLQFKIKDIAGNEVDLARYRGKVLLIVNVASRCGYTPQYQGLQALHEKYAERGLAILAFPCNQFRNQEPGTSEEIAAFCEKNYGVEFDLFEKIEVNGDEQCPLYQYLTTKETNPKTLGPIKWNFEKFLVGRDGAVIGQYRSKVAPESEELVKAIEAALGPKEEKE